jgi:hypothetical protein
MFWRGDVPAGEPGDVERDVEANYDTDGSNGHDGPYY